MSGGMEDKRKHTERSLLRKPPEVGVDLDADAAGRGPGGDPAAEGGVLLVEE